MLQTPDKLAGPRWSSSDLRGRPGWSSSGLTSRWSRVVLRWSQQSVVQGGPAARSQRPRRRRRAHLVGHLVSVLRFYIAPTALFGPPRRKRLAAPSTRRRIARAGRELARRPECPARRACSVPCRAAAVAGRPSRSTGTNVARHMWPGGGANKHGVLFCRAELCYFPLSWR